MLIVWLTVGIGSLLVLGILAFGLFGQVKRLRTAVNDAQSALAPQVDESARGIQRAQALRTHAGVDTKHGVDRHA